MAQNNSNNAKKKPAKPKVKPEDEMPVMTPELEAGAKELEAAGLAKEKAERFMILAEKALRDASSHLAVFPLRDWDKKLSACDPDFIEALAGTSKWQQIRQIAGKAIGLKALSKTSIDSPWALYTTERLEKLETEIIELAKRQTNDHPIPQHLLDEAFAARPTMAEEQRLATVACSSGTKAVMVTEGTAGAGKSFTLNAIREIYEKVPGRTPAEAEGYDIIGTALSWTATKVLEASAGLSGGKAIEGLTRAMDQAKEKGEEFFKRRTVLIVDEAGLVGLGHMHKLLWHAANSAHPVRVILTGDSLQLNPVMAGNALEAIVDECGSARLDTIRRQKQDSHRRAVKHFCFGRAENALWTYWQQEACHFCADNESRREKVMRDYVRYVVSNPQKNALVLALENKEVKILNEQIRQRLKAVGRLVGKEYPIKVTDGKGAFYANFAAGDQIVLRKNNVEHPVYKSKFKKVFEGLAKAEEDAKNQKPAQFSAGFGKGLLNVFNRLLGALSQPQPKKEAAAAPEEEIDRKGVFNRMAGIILNIREHPTEKGHHILRILFAEGGETDIDTSVYRDEDADAVPINHNFATTIYASQGQTVERVFMIDSPYMNRRLAYVGMSRHTELCDIYFDCTELKERMEKERALRSDGAKTAITKAQTQLDNAATPDQASAAGKRLEKLRKELSEWEPKWSCELRPSDYLKVAAFTWNKDSQNPTPRMAAKHMSDKRDKAAKLGADAWLPKKHPDDDPEDNHPTAKPEDDPDMRHPEPPLFEDLASAHERRLTREQNGKTDAGDEELELFSSSGQEKRDLPDYCSDPLAAKTLADTRKKFWDINRYGYPRIFSQDPVLGHPVSRWSFDGALKAGDGDIPVLTNEAAFRKAPWLIVQNTRQLLLSWSYYREKHPGSPERVPNIACAYPASDLASLAKWFPPGKRPVWCAWSPKDPDSLSKAKELVARLTDLGHKAALYPKEPEPRAAVQAPKP